MQQSVPVSKVENRIIPVLNDVLPILEEEPSVLALPSDEPIVFVGDTHGDAEVVEQVISTYLRNHVLYFKGDYIDRAPEVVGSSLDNILSLFEAKIRHPQRIFLGRGNHEFEETFRTQKNGFADEIEAEQDPEKSEELIERWCEVFSHLPYASTTESGVLALHAGIPSVVGVEQSLFQYLPSCDPETFYQIPKGVRMYREHQCVSQIVFNEHFLPFLRELSVRTQTHNPYSLLKTSMQIASDFRKGYTRALKHWRAGFRHGYEFFDRSIQKLGMKVLVRGHQASAKGYTMNDRALTVMTTRSHAKDGMMPGVYVAVLDPQQDITNARDLRIDHIR